jgi:hypothetical protein
MEFKEWLENKDVVTEGYKKDLRNMLRNQAMMLKNLLKTQENLNWFESLPEDQKGEFVRSEASKLGYSPEVGNWESYPHMQCPHCQNPIPGEHTGYTHGILLKLVRKLLPPS